LIDIGIYIDIDKDEQINMNHLFTPRREVWFLTPFPFPLPSPNPPTPKPRSALAASIALLALVAMTALTAVLILGPYE
jgi:hypothetical protein